MAVVALAQEDGFRLLQEDESVIVLWETAGSIVYGPPVRHRDGAGVRYRDPPPVRHRDVRGVRVQTGGNQR